MSSRPMPLSPPYLFSAVSIVAGDIFSPLIATCEQNMTSVYLPIRESKELTYRVALLELNLEVRGLIRGVLR